VINIEFRKAECRKNGYQERKVRYVGVARPCHTEHIEKYGPRQETKADYIGQRIQFLAYRRLHMQCTCGQSIEEVKDSRRKHTVRSEIKLDCEGEGYTNTPAVTVHNGRA